MALEISHIVVNGCSFTYCQGLDSPSEQGWPALLGKKLNVPVVNLAVKGSGNDGIFRRTLDYYYSSKDIVSKPLYIIAFSQAMRREEFVINYKGNKVRNFQGLANFGEEPIERAIFEHLDDVGEYYMEFKKLLYWVSIINLFKANNIPYIITNYMCDHMPSIELLKKNHKNLYESCHEDFYKIKDFFEITSFLDKTSCGHDGINSQYVLSDYSYSILNEKFGQVNKSTENYDYFTLDNYVYSQSGKYFHDTVWSLNNEWLENKLK